MRKIRILSPVGVQVLCKGFQSTAGMLRLGFPDWQGIELTAGPGGGSKEARNTIMNRLLKLTLVMGSALVLSAMASAQGTCMVVKNGVSRACTAAEEKAGAAAREASEHAREQAREAREKAREMSREAREVRERADGDREKAREASRAAREQAHEARDKAREEAREASREAREAAHRA